MFYQSTSIFYQNFNKNVLQKKFTFIRIKNIKKLIRFSFVIPTTKNDELMKLP